MIRPDATMYLMRRLLLLGSLFVLPAEALTLANEQWRIVLDPATLAAEAILSSGDDFVISSPGPSQSVTRLQQDGKSASWLSGVDAGVHTSVRLDGDRLILTLSKNKSGELVWPRVPSGAKALLIPIQEGFRIPTDHKLWRKELVDAYQDINTTEGLTLPVVGFDYGAHQLSVLFANPFNNRLHFTLNPQGIGLNATHTVNRLNVTKPYEVQVSLTSGQNWLAPAKAYRRWLQERGEWVSLDEKLASVKDGEKLIGASHLYLWGDRLLVPQDVKSWDELRRLMPVGWLKGESKTALNAPDLTHNRYSQESVLTGIEQALFVLHPGLNPADFSARKIIATKHVGAALNEPASWGDSGSTKMIAALKKAGLPRLWLGLPQWSEGFASPEGVISAKKAGYLIAPYDSYDTALPEGNQQGEWLTAQMGNDIYQKCGVMLESGERVKGFQGHGVYTNPTCVRPIMEKRVKWLQKNNHYNSWFLDVDATGMVFDDFDPTKLTSQEKDAENRMAGMAWISKSQGVLLGSEQGGAVVNRTAAFAHGTQPGGFFGWNDDDMRENRSSPYFLGAWHPGYQPAFFFKQSRLKPRFQALYYDPSIRLPLYQAAFHDSIVTSYHWMADSLKFKEVRQVSELLQQLYNMPPLLNISLDSAKKRIPYLIQLDDFFRPLHETLYNKEIIGFRWLEPNGYVQETTFSNGMRLIANFGGARKIDGMSLAMNSVLAIYPNGMKNSFVSR